MPDWIKRCIEPAKEITGAIRDIGLIIGVPVIIVGGIKFYDLQDKAYQQQAKAYEAEINALVAQNTVLKETQYDRALQLIQSQKQLYELDKVKNAESIKELNKKISDLKGGIELSGKMILCTTKYISGMSAFIEEMDAFLRKALFAKVGEDVGKLVEGINTAPVMDQSCLSLGDNIGKEK